VNFYNFSGGMESAAMLVVDKERIRSTSAIVRFADTGKQFPEAEASRKQIEEFLGISIVVIPPRISFDEFLFEKGGMIRKGTTDCSRRMKRGNLNRHMKTFPRPYEINLGLNVDEQQRADEFISRNERDWCHWRFPLIEAGISRPETWDICRKAGFSILVAMYEKMGRFDCFWCGNQKPSQARLVAEHYPELAKEWMAAEEKKGHSFMPIPLKVLIEPEPLFAAMDERAMTSCSCFGGSDTVFDDELGEE
jgi:3'-phosphoadenosine 5'-phosphosulfate sulfotransferase (PAPS reductase)/FAD synthetase